MTDTRLIPDYEQAPGPREQSRLNPWVVLFASVTLAGAAVGVGGMTLLAMRTIELGAASVRDSAWFLAAWTLVFLSPLAASCVAAREAWRRSRRHRR